MLEKWATTKPIQHEACRPIREITAMAGDVLIAKDRAVAATPRSFEHVRITARLAGVLQGMTSVRCRFWRPSAALTRPSVTRGGHRPIVQATANQVTPNVARR